MMTTSEEDITRGHELYLRHLLLLGQAAPVFLVAIIEREVSKRGKSLADLLIEHRDTLKSYHDAEFRQVFKDEEVNTDIDSWDTLTLCVVILVLFDSRLATVEREAITVIKDQRNDLNCYSHFASINYKTFKEKWAPLHSALLDLLESIHDEKRFECTRMIHSFKSEDTRINLHLIKRIKQTNDVKLHIQMVIQDNSAPKIYGDTDKTCDKDDEDDTRKPLKIDKALHVATEETHVRDNLDINLVCTTNLPMNKVVWRHNNRDIKQSSRHIVSVRELEHKLTIKNVKIEDNGEYTVDFGDVASSITLALKDNPVFTERLQETCVFLGDPAILTCRLNVPEKTVTWQHDYKPVQETETIIAVKKECAHWLAISHAKLEDAGFYSCACGNSSTATFLKVLEKPLVITKWLHVATTEAEVTENMDIILTCEVNQHTNKAVWRHNGQLIKLHTRRVVSIEELEHRLTIRNAKFEDEGDYTVYFGDVKSSIKLKIKGQPLKIIETLHVTTIESDVRLHEDIVMLCTVDQHTDNPVWLHNNTEIKPSDRLLVTVQEHEHRLTIRDATLEDEGDYTVDFGEATSSTTLIIKENPVFTNRLHDMFVYVGEPAIITCKLNDSGRPVTWRHNYQLVEETDNLKLVADNRMHWLAISNTKLTDAGYYSCVCGIESTTASLKVSERPLMITEELHVATVDADVRENMDLVLKCAVNLYTNEVIWQHDGTKITQGFRYLIAVQGLEHTLTVRNAKFEDDGDYTVAFGEKKSSTNIKIKGNVNLLLKKQLTEDLYKNWVRGALGIKYLKLGIQEFVENAVQSHHFEIMKQLGSAGNVCTNCTEDVLLPSHTQELCPRKSKCLCSKQPKKRRVCQSQGFCSKFYDKIFFDHRFFDLSLTNTDIQSWGTNPWSVATCYISTTGYRGKPSAKEVDCSGLLSLLINNNFIHRSLGDVEINGETDLFQQARDARNDILHNANYELAEGQLQCYIDLFKAVLEIKDAKSEAPLSGQPGAKDAIGYLNELQNKQIDIRISQDFQRQIQDIKEHSRGELAEKMKEAEKQNYMKVQQLEEQLKMTEKNLQLMRDLRLLQAKRKHKDPFELELHIQVNGPTGVRSKKGKRRIYQTMKKYVERIEAPINSINESVHRLLGYISKPENCYIIDAFKQKKSAYIKIHCYTCKAIEEILKLINGNEFQEEIVVLRKCLERDEHIKVHAVIVSCSLESIENTRQRLFGCGPSRTFTCNNHQGRQCTWYCSDHDIFCCSTCKDSDHRSCVGIKQVVSERSYRKQNQTLVVKRNTMIRRYNVRIKNRVRNRDDNDGSDCDISSIRMLPDGNILLVDDCNNKLKKLDSSYNVVCHCDIPYDRFHWSDVCYIGNDRAVVCYQSGRIQYVKVCSKIKLEHDIQLDHRCYALAYYGDTLYVRDGNTIYTYNRDCQGKHTLYNIQDTNSFACHIAVSDDGERIYITNDRKGIITIDNKGNHLFTLNSDIWNETADVCVVGDGTVLVLDTKGYVHQLDYSGKQVLGTVVGQSDVLYMPHSLCFDRQQCRIIVAETKGHYIAVFRLTASQQ